MLDLLRPYFPGDWAQYGESLQLMNSRPPRLSVAQWLSDPTQLETALTRHAESLNGAHERKAVASDWILRYLTALLPPIVALSSPLKYRLPVSSHEMVLTLNDSGMPMSFAIPHLGAAMPEADAATRYESLVWQHLDPFITHLVRQTRLPTKILWGNVRRSLLGILEQALPVVSANTALSTSLIEDRRALMESPLWTDGRTAQSPLPTSSTSLPAP